jgi:DNA-binding transcriptional regulator YiaG
MRASAVRSIRHRMGLTQEHFATLLGVTRVTVARWETGKVAVTEPMAKLIRMVTKARMRTRAEN